MGYILGGRVAALVDGLDVGGEKKDSKVSPRFGAGASGWCVIAFTELGSTGMRMIWG